MRVTIIGAGVIGLVLAKELAGSGIDTVVHDGKKSVEDGANKASGILSKTGLSRIGIDYRSAIVNDLDGAVLHAGKERLVIKSKATQAYVLDRAKLASICKTEAEGAGAEVRLGERLERQELKELAADSSNIVVGADGAVSTVASAFGFPPIGEYVLTYKAEYAGADVQDWHSVELFFATGHSHRFFGWAAPYAGSELELGIGTSDRGKRSSSDAFGNFIKNREVSSMISKAKRLDGHASMIPLEARRMTARGNVLLVGDAAGQVKATTGGGIIFGTSCAKIAAKAIARHAERGTPLSSYESEWRKAYGMDLKLHSALHSYYSRMGPAGFEALIKMSRLFGVEAFLGRYGDMDSPSKMLKRFMLRGFAK